MNSEEDYKYYKDYHERFMQNHNGTTAFETVSALLSVPISVSIIIVSPFLFETYRSLVKTNICNFLTEFVVLVCPQILFLTIISKFVNAVGIGILVLLIFTMIMCYNISKPNIFVASVEKKEFVTNFRSSMILVTAICILAVDFKIFPRKYAKTETFGYGLMDTGVGGFVFSNALVSREAFRKKFAHRSFYYTLTSSIPLVILGTLRYLTTVQIDYQQHVSEYGIHWNFFFTLAFTKIACSLLLMLEVCNNYPLLIALFIIIVHQTLLIFGIEDWVLSDVPRNNFLTANREGIVSSLGYVALYFVGVYIGQLIHRKSKYKDHLVLGTKLIVITILFWVCTIVSSKFFRVSRRLANIGYFMWLSAYNLSFITVYLYIDLFTCFVLDRYKTKVDTKSVINRVPVLLEAVSYNGLIFFLIANLLTGIINVSIRTLKVGTFPSILILNMYMLVVCGITVFLFHKRIKLKVW